MRTGPCHDVFGEGRQNLLNYAIMGMTKLGGPISGTQADPLSVDEGEKGKNGRQLARGNDRVAAIEAGPERCWAWRADGCEGTGIEVATACKPDVLFAIEQCG